MANEKKKINRDDPTEEVVKARVKTAFEHATPRSTPPILSGSATNSEKGRIIMMKESKNPSKLIRRAAGIAAAFVLLCGIGIGLFTYQASAVNTTVSLDVNPSVEITVNKGEKVIAVTPLNEDGKAIVGDLDFKGSDLDVAVYALIGSMLDKGYITEISNSILLSVNSKDEKTGAELRQRLSEEINAQLQTESFSGAVLSQTVTEDQELKALAETYGISLGKAKLIRQITLQNTAYTFEDLVQLNINELNLLTESGSTRLEAVESVGTASDKKYIGAEAARQIAITHATVDEANVTKYESELDFEKGVMVYDIEFDCEGFEYDYDINAETGEVIKSDKEQEGKKNQSATTPGSNNSGNSNGNNSGNETAYIGENAALSAALTHAGLAADAAVERYECKLDREKGQMVYELEFVFEGCEYDYDINAESGAVVKYEKESKEVYTAPPASAEASAPGSIITEAQAKAVALAHAGFAETEVQKLKCELDKDDGVLVYEIEFKVGSTEYEYEIAANGGAVVKYDVDKDD